MEDSLKNAYCINGINRESDARDILNGYSQLLKMGLLIFSIFLFYYILLYITYITVLLKVVGRFCPCRLLASKSLLRYYSIGKSTL